MSFPSKNNTAFPAEVADLGSFLRVLQDAASAPGGGSYTARDDLTIPISATALNKLTADNPVASAEIFHRLQDAVYSCLIGLAPSHISRKSVPYADRPVGIFGRPAAIFSVIEVQQRLSLHSHMVIWGNVSSRMLALASTRDALKRAVCEVLDSQITAQMPVEQHIAGLLQRAEHRVNRHKARYSYDVCPLPSEDPHGFLQRVFDIHDATSFHEHADTCHKGKPDIRCRLCYERALRPDTTVVQLAPDFGSSDFVATDDIAAPHPSSQFSRSRREYPLPNVDARALVWEMARPQTPFPDVESYGAAAFTSGTVLDPAELLRRIDAIEGEKAELIKTHLRRIVCVRNAGTVDISPTATALLACNTAAVLLGCSESCKSTLFYLLKYITKDSTALGHSLTVLRDAVATRNARQARQDKDKEQKDKKVTEQLNLID